MVAVGAIAGDLRGPRPARSAPFLQTRAAGPAALLAPVARLFSVQAVSWGIASLVAGSASDRLGRRAILVAAVVLLGATRLGFAWSDSYAAAMVWQVISGIGGGAFMGTVFAAVSDNVPAGARGRALSWIITGQSLSLVLGVPIVTLLGTLGGWRGALAVHGAFTIVCALAVRLSTPTDPVRDPNEAHGKAPLVRYAAALVMLAAGTTERLCFARSPSSAHLSAARLTACPSDRWPPCWPWWHWAACSATCSTDVSRPHALARQGRGASAGTALLALPT